MASNKETVYVKADRNIEVTKPDVTLGDVLKIECADPTVAAKIRTLKLLVFHHTDKKNQNRTAVSVLRVIEIIHEAYPGIDIQNMGEPDFIVTYEKQRTAGGVVHILKAAVVVIISFTGSAFSVMAFNNDAGVTKVFSQIYKLVMGAESSGFTMLELTYSVGLVIGILTFFNHFGTKRFSVDPTPMEVEMRLYENDLQTTLIENISRKEKELDVGKRTRSGRHRT